MGFVKTLHEIAGMHRETYDFFDAEMLTVFFETSSEIIERLLPPPLEPVSVPLGFAFTANYPKTNFGVDYRESGLFVQASFKGEEGSYCLAMPVSNDMAMIGGREMFGYPKKIGEIGLTRRGKRMQGWTERRGFRFLEMAVNLTGTFNVPEVQSAFTPTAEAHAIIYNFKYFPAPDGAGFDYHPRLVREVVVMRPKSVEVGEAELFLRSSQWDPWGDVEPVRVLGAVYSIGDNSMLKGSVVAEADPAAFLPFITMKVDGY